MHAHVYTRHKSTRAFVEEIYSTFCNIYWKGDTALTFLMGVHDLGGIGTPHNIETTLLKIQDGFPTDVVVGWFGWCMSWLVVPAAL